MRTYRILNQTRNTQIASAAQMADTFLTRGRGLMGRASLPSGGGLVLFPNNNIHMFFMRMPLDVIFLDRQHCVVGLRRNFKPWRPFAGARNARYTLELPVGVIDASQTELGDQCAFDPPHPV